MLPHDPPRTIDVRILAATDEHLSERVRDGGFREDLYFRLTTVVLRLPPLRDRGDDVALIAAALLQRLAAEHDLPVPTLTPAMLGLNMTIASPAAAAAPPTRLRTIRHGLEFRQLLGAG